MPVSLPGTAFGLLTRISLEHALADQLPSAAERFAGAAVGRFVVI
jgi:hypothetical protein